MVNFQQHKIEKLKTCSTILLMLYALVAPVSISATYVALGVITFTGIIMLYSKGLSDLKFQMHILVPFFLLYIWYAVSALLGGNFESGSALRGIKEISPIILFPIFLQTARVDKERIIWVLLISASLVCLLGLIQYFSPSVVYPIRWQLINGNEFTGFFTDMNHFGSGGFFSITTALVFALILFWQCTQTKKIFLWMLFILNFVALLLTFARSYYVSIIAVLITLMLLKNWKLFVSGTVTLTAIMLVMLSFPNPVNTRVKTIFDPHFSSNAERIYIWKMAVEMIKDHPAAGVGKGNWEKQSKEVYSLKFKNEYTFPDSAFVNAHNLYLSVLAETGIIGLAMFFLFWGAIVWTMLNKLPVMGIGSFDYALTIGTMFSLGNLFIAGFFEYNFVTLIVLLLISFLVALSLHE